jgi:hypothetical protein
MGNSGVSNMLGSVQVDTVLVQEGLLLPGGLKVETESYSTHWRLVAALALGELDHDINAAGWNLFFSGLKTSSNAFGSGGPESMRRATFNALGKVRSQYFNCAEIVSISKKHFLGIPYITVSARPHHIQPGGYLQSHDERKRLQRHADWALA